MIIVIIYIKSWKCMREYPFYCSLGLTRYNQEKNFMICYCGKLILLNVEVNKLLMFKPEHKCTYKINLVFADLSSLSTNPILLQTLIKKVDVWHSPTVQDMSIKSKYCLLFPSEKNLISEIILSFPNKNWWAYNVAQ